jgi:thiosulfate dehydrogenase
MSTPYGPYSDPFSAKQHQLGPFGPIADYYKKEFGIIKTK